MYCSILKEKMLPSLRALGRRALFQHDNDPKHTSKATVGFLKKNRVKVIQWPSMSPDLNPIEHLWGILKRQVEHHSPSSIQSLKEVILEEWKKIDLAKCRQLVHSMLCVLRPHLAIFNESGQVLNPAGSVPSVAEAVAVIMGITSEFSGRFQDGLVLSRSSWPRSTPPLRDHGTRRHGDIQITVFNDSTGKDQV